MWKFLHNIEMITDRIKLIIDHEDLSIRAFEEAIETSQGVISKALKSGSDIKSSVLNKIVSKFPQYNPEWLLTGEGLMLKSNKENSKKLYSTQDSEPHMVAEPNQLLLKGGVPVADINVAAGTGYLNHDHIDIDDVIQLPPHMLSKGYHLCVRIKGDSMAPTLQDSGYIIIRLLDPSEWDCMRDEHIYVVSDKEGKAYLKRVKNRVSKGFITLMSDSPDKASYPNFNLELDELNTIWHAEWYLSAKMPNIHNQYYSRLQRLEDKVDALVHKNKK